ncbi:MAG TPA: TolC family protein [Blastocatellia bacterium]
MRKGSLIIGLLITWCGAADALAQAPTTLTLKQAETLALTNHPQIKSAAFTALAARAAVVQVRSVYYPQVQGATTGVEATTGARITAGLLNNPSIFARYADGAIVNQFITDFGHTGDLVQTSILRATAQDQNTVASRATVLVVVDEAYFGALKAQSVLAVAHQTVDLRQSVADQVSALEKSGYKSGLDLSFAEVDLSQAKLLLLQAQSDADAAFALLNAAMGLGTDQMYTLVEEPPPPALPSSAEEMVSEALRDRPDLLSSRLNRDADFKYVEAEKKLWYPTVSTVGVAGVTPFHVSQITSDYYVAAGFNVTIPIFNGHLFSAERAEAEYNALASDQNVKNQENLISRDVRVAWLTANTAYQALSVTAQLLANATEAMTLARARYDLGLSSIVELSQAQLNLTQAQIANASAKYDYQIRRSELSYQIGSLH